MRLGACFRSATHAESQKFFASFFQKKEHAFVRRPRPERQNIRANSQPAPEYPSSAKAIYAIAVLMLPGFVVFADRQILVLRVGPVRAEPHISDVQMSLLQGFALVAFLFVAALPMGWLADRFSRRTILAGGVLFWSVTAALRGVSPGFSQLLIARLGLGLGISTYGPTAFSMVADMVPPRSRSRAMAFVAGWHLVLVAVAVPGFLALPLLFTVRERQGQGSTPGPRWRQGLQTAIHRSSHNKVLERDSV